MRVLNKLTTEIKQLKSITNMFVLRRTNGGKIRSNLRINLLDTRASSGGEERNRTIDVNVK